jgi:hypothetical protein
MVIIRSESSNIDNNPNAFWVYLFMPASKIEFNHILIFPVKRSGNVNKDSLLSLSNKEGSAMKEPSYLPAQPDLFL